MFRFFNTKKMLEGHVKALRRSRRKLVTEKVLNYENELFFEHDSFEKAVYVMPDDDFILNELATIEIAENGDYDYSALSPAFKRYMRLKDDEFFNKAYNDWANRDKMKELRENREIDKVEGHYDRGLFESELEMILSGDRVKIETPMHIKARKSNRRAYKTVMELIRANIDMFESFVTLTFADIEHEVKYNEKGLNFELVDDVMDFEGVKKVFSNFMKTFAQKIRRDGHTFEYIAVYEEHKSGKYHFHLISSPIPNGYLVDCPEVLDIDYKTGQRRNGKMIADWLHGKSDVDIIRDKERMSSYLCKYLVKNFMKLEDTDESYQEFLGKKKYFPSRGLKRPKVEYIADSEEHKKEIIENKKVEYLEVYSTTYNNPYNDSQITRTICSKKIIS